METEFDIFRIVAALIKMSTIFKKTIVIYGQDLLLLETRSLLLARFGLHPVAVASLPEVQNIIKSCDLDLLVVCASVPDQIAELLLEEIEKSGKSEIKTLLLRTPVKSDDRFHRASDQPVAPHTFQSVVGALVESDAAGD